jgi:hypothetical protein
MHNVRLRRKRELANDNDSSIKPIIFDRWKREIHEIHQALHSLDVEQSTPTTTVNEIEVTIGAQTTPPPPPLPA